MIVVDGVALQSNLETPPSIITFWQNVVGEWLKLGHSRDFVVLVRESQRIALPGDTVIAVIPDYSYEDAESDHVGLQSACDQLKSTLFISTLYTYPLRTPSVAMIYSVDESQEFLSNLAAQEKHNSILNASAFICPSEWVASNLMAKYPGISKEDIEVIYPGLHGDLGPSPPLKLRKFREERDLTRPYIIYRAGAGERRKIAFRAILDSLSEIASGQVPEVVYLSVDGSRTDSPLESFVDLSKPIRARIHNLKLSPDELPLLYTGATGLLEVEPELGMGNYVLEAMRCGCPVIILRESQRKVEHANAPEPWIEIPLEPHAISQAIDQLRDTKYRSSVLSQGLIYTKNMTWEEAAKRMWSFLDLKAKNITS
ncbi:hypothetical protein NW851_00615 [Synechococcus sp. H55.7]|uniref:hypothetical protein n=1 Tax=unclassified Synechococcus TaxID=2626047 RepID=UPI0039C23369